ncbi:hypothetical protein ABZ896_52170 [Streptomyces sp. NPDC047072]|uniref:hypothetical protein n=1 Tax=Streptomyces sp. NPDC047072 TaxID=3154809 RepID=UPI0033F7EB3F
MPLRVVSVPRVLVGAGVPAAGPEAEVAATATAEGAGQPARFGAVDGLRGVAVLSVLLYDAGVGSRTASWAGAGFEVLPVVSGFLATLPLVRRATATGRTGAAGFLGRRVKRLTPALLLVTALTLGCAWALGVARPDREILGRAPAELFGLTALFLLVWPPLLALLGLLAGRRLAVVTPVAVLLGGAAAVTAPAARLGTPDRPRCGSNSPTPRAT